MSLNRTIALAGLAVAFSGRIGAVTYLDLAPFAQLTSWSGSEPHRLTDLDSARKAENLGLEWDEERDIREVRIQFHGEPRKGAALEYWFKNWPWDPPKMPSVEDPMDDPWQGRWLKAAVKESCGNSECRYVFAPLAANENPRADKLPGVRYRRTLKVRISWPSGAAGVAQLQAFSDSQENPLQLRIQMPGGAGTLDRESLSVYNGYLRGLKADEKGADLDVVAAKPGLAGSEDLTVLTVRSAGARRTGQQNRTFSFCTRDLERGPIEIPEFGVRIVNRNGRGASPPSKQKIR